MFDHEFSTVRLQGVPTLPVLGTSVSAAQVQAMVKSNSILYMVHLNAIDADSQAELVLPPEIQELLSQFSDLFEEPTTIPPPRAGDHQIPLMAGAQPFRLRPYRYSPTLKDEIEKQITEMLLKGWIQHSSSPFSSPILMVKKKTGDWRLCVDFMRLNALTIKNKYPLPVIDEILDELFGTCWFTSLDMCSGFHQIRMK